MVMATYHRLKKYLQIQVEIPQEMQVEVRLLDREDWGVEVYWEGLLGPAHSLHRILIHNHETGITRNTSFEHWEKSADGTNVPHVPPSVKSDPVCSMEEREDHLRTVDHGKKSLSHVMQYLQR